MPESVRDTASKTDVKVEKAVAEDRAPEVRPHPANLHAQLLFQQKTVGNRAVQRLIKSGSLHPHLKVTPPPRRQSPERDEEMSLQPVHNQTVKRDIDNVPLQSDRAAHKIPRITQPGSLLGFHSPETNLHPKQNTGTPNIHRAWYNFDIPFTDYQFDPSLEGIKTAANVVKDTAVSGFEWIVDEIKGLVSSGIDWLSEKWNALQDFASSALEAAKSSFTDIVGLLKSPLNVIADAIMSLDAQAVSKAWAKFSGFITTVSNGFKAMTDNLLAQVNKVWGGISGFATSLLDKVAGLTQNFIFKKLPDALQNIAFSVIGKLKTLWKSIDDGWNALFKKIKTWVDDAIDKVFAFVKRVLSFGIDVLVTGIIQFGQIVLFLKDLFSNPKKYVAILADKSVQAFDGVESKFAGVVSRYFGGATKAAPAATAITTVHRQPASTTAAEPKTSATWGEIGSGILQMMGKKWNEFKSNPLSIVTGLLMDMVLPIVGNVKDIIKLYEDIKKVVTGPLSAGSLEELWTSILQILDIPILIYQTVVSILMRSLMVPLIVATFIPHPLVKAIAAAVGEALLAAFVGAEVMNIEQKILLLKTGATVKAQKDEAYNRVADSLIALAMTAVIILIMLILHFIANLMKGIFNFVKGKVFRVETPAVGEGRGPAEGKGKGPAQDVKPADTKTEGLPSEDTRRRIKIDEKGKCEVCASPCDDIREKYDLVITPEDEAKIKAIEDDPSLSDTEKEEKLKPIEQDLAEADKKAQALRGKEPVKPKLDGKDYKRILAGELVDLSDFMNESGEQLKIDPDYRPPQDAKGRTNAERAKDGLASILPNGDGVELHHTGQDFFSPLDEHSRSFHQSVLNDPDFHPSTGDPGYLSWRGEVAWYKGQIRLLGDIYDLIRGKYWRARFK